jgi:tRNA threonylcarbamoyladenosine biosynthesis protein TsaB
LSDEVTLAVDTCFGACSAAVLRGTRVLAHTNVAMERGHAEALASMVESVMRGADLEFAALDKLAVTTGPGTFTGQRVGLAFMRGLRLALGKPLVGITSLAAMAERARHELGTTIAAAVHDARRGEVYLEVVGSALPACVMTFDDAGALLRKLADLALTGTGAARMAEATGATQVFDAIAPDAIWVARLAAGKHPSTPPRPLYLRAPDAKLPVQR